MPDLSKALGDVYGQAPEPTVAGRQIDDDLAAALSAALVNAPAISPPTESSGPFAGALRDLSAVPPSPAPSAPAVVAAVLDSPAVAPVAAASSPAPPAAQTPLPGPPWRREDDDILPGGSSGRKKARRGLHLGRR